ncbi:dihydrodipicolinate synthase family protein, partial [Acinetobacter baumannii]
KGDFSEVSRVLNQTDLLYFSGDDANVLPHLAIGATGLIGVTANITAAGTNGINGADVTATNNVGVVAGNNDKAAVFAGAVS